MNAGTTTSPERVIGFDCHPDSFTAAILRGSTPANAIEEKIFNQVPMQELQGWVRKHTTEKDLIVLEASGNSFEVHRTFAKLGRNALVLESCQLGRLKDISANNDRFSAVRIAKAFLSGNAKVVWVPDLNTQRRRDWLHTHQKATRRTTQMINRTLSYLSDNGVRLSKKALSGQNPEKEKELIRGKKEWIPGQWQVIEAYLEDLSAARHQRERWRSLIAAEVLNDPEMLSITRLCGVRDVTAFAVMAIVGDIKRFKSPGSLVKYLALSPSFDQSGKGSWKGPTGRAMGRKDLRCLLIEGAQAILRCSNNAMARWGKKLLARKSVKNLVVVAIARKLAVAIWYLLMGKWTRLEEIDTALEAKLSKMVSQVAPVKEMPAKVGMTRKEFLKQVRERMKTGREYVLYPSKEIELAQSQLAAT